MIISASATIKPLPNTDNIIVKFYLGERVHPSRYTIDDVWRFSYEQLEKTHDYIQWIFPLTIPSSHVQDIPILNKEEVHEFRTNEILRPKVLNSFRLMLNFYGFEMTGDTIIPSPEFKNQSGWLYPKNHNYLRISRILESLLLLGFRDESETFLSALISIYPDFRWDIGESLSVWKKILDRTMY
ncbi:MAG: opioid growth factor receptor-related protein [Candidatus Bathyarchaeia archaeon]|jgi:hypothetical protein